VDWTNVVGGGGNQKRRRRRGGGVEFTNCNKIGEFYYMIYIKVSDSPVAIFDGSHGH
jgi:hypothetical protein